MLTRLPLFICLLLLSDAGAEVRESLDYQYYDATAKPGQNLALSLNNASPIRENGRVFHGHTKWNVRWNFQWDQRSDGSCRITSTKTSVTGTIIMPRLAGGSADQNQAFERYVSALMRHEMGHYQFGKDAAVTIDRALQALPAMNDCPSLEKTANEGAYRALQRYQEKERQYDVDTGNGKSQGAWLDK